MPFRFWDKIPKINMEPKYDEVLDFKYEAQIFCFIKRMNTTYIKFIVYIIIKIQKYKKKKI